MMASKVIFQVFYYDLCFSIKLLEAFKLRVERVLGFGGSSSQSCYCFVVRENIRNIPSFRFNLNLILEILQDEKNQILMTNVWLNLVSIYIQKVFKPFNKDSVICMSL